MATISSHSVSVLLFSIVVGFCGVVTAMRVELETTKYDGMIPKTFTLTCIPESRGSCAREVLALQLARKEGKPIVTLKPDSGVTYNPFWKTNIKAEGSIDQDASKSRLAVTFSDPLKEDSGEYICTMLYLDQWGYFQQDVATENITMEGHDVPEVVKYLLEQVSSFENETAELREQIDEQNELLEKIQMQLEAHGFARIGNKTFHVKDCVGKTYEGYCYIYNNRAFSFREGKSYCSAIGGSVAVPRYRGEADFIKKLVKSKITWIGITDENVEGIWMDSTGSKITWTNWAEDEPNNIEPHGEHCATMTKNTKWNDVNCEDIYRGIVCSKKMSTQ